MGVRKYWELACCEFANGLVGVPGLLGLWVLGTLDSVCVGGVAVHDGVVETRYGCLAL